MKFFFPDSQDFVDPSFDMVTEERSPTRVRQRDDRYAHELFAKPPYDGVLVSMATVNGFGAGTGKYSLAQRARFLRQGVREFVRLPDSSPIETFGDCGAFSYWREAEPPFGPQEAFDFYEGCGFDYGLSVDHVIPVYRPDFDTTIPMPGIGSEVEKWKERQAITLELAAEFKRLSEARKTRFEPVGVAQGWSPKSCSHAVKKLQGMGYEMIALGGMVPRNTGEILEILQAVSDVRASETRLHLLGVTRLDVIGQFADLGVASFDSTAPLMRAFKDKDKNYFLGSRTFSAIRVPQVDGNPKFKRRMLAGLVDPERARVLEGQVLRLLGQYDAEEADLETTLAAVLEYESLFDPDADREAAYRQVLTDRPWQRCDCEICNSIGIHVIIFRGAERNRRRGFHNLYEFKRALAGALDEVGSQPPAKLHRAN
jgi:hypothetical protein